MARKKASLSESDKAFLQKNRGRAMEELVTATEKPQGLIEDYLKTLPPLKKTQFSEGKNSVAMTGAQSEADDKIVQGSTNHEFLKRRVGSYHIIDPSKPVL
jgi:hypothetical protein